MKIFTPVSSRARTALAFSGMLLATLQAAAQTAPAENAASPAKKEEVLTLNDFVVTTNRTSGYRATNSITATGVGTEIGNTPMMINVVTKDLIADTRSDLVIDALRFVPGVVTSPTNESQPAVRGFTGTYSLRNGVFRRQNLTTWNVDRVEVIQGSSSIFYSNIRPGGVINYITSKPQIGKTFADVSISGGTDSYYRGEGAFNIAAGDNLAFRLVVGGLNSDTYRRDFNETQSFLSFSGLWNITPNQQLTFEIAGEQTWRRNAWSSYPTPLTNSRYWNNAAAIASGQTLSAYMAANYPGMPLYDMFAPFSPRADDPYGYKTPIMTNTYQHATDRPVDLTYNLKLTDSLVFSIISNYAFEDNEGINPVIGDFMADGTLPSIVAERFINVRDSWNLNTKLTYRVDGFGIKHTMIIGNDNQWVTQRFPQVNGSNNQRGPAILNFNPQTMGAPNGWANILQSTAPFNSVRKNVQYFKGTYFVDQLAMLDDKLYVVAGVRDVGFRQTVTYSGAYQGTTTTTLPTPPPDAVVQKWTPQFGALYKLGPVGLFATYSESVIPQTQIDASGNTVLPINGKGFDTGAKFDLLKGALTGTVSYFDIKQTNTAISDSAQNIAHGLPANATFGYYTYGNAQQVRGGQVDLAYNISSDTQLIASWNHFFQVENVAPQSNPLTLGVPISYQPKDMVDVWTKYQPTSGALKGWSFGGGFRHNTETILGGDFNRSQLKIPAFTVFDALIGYQAKLLERNVDFRLNVKNLFDKVYRDGGSTFGAGRAVFLSATTRF